jgi:hypothetical protein
MAGRHELARASAPNSRSFDPVGQPQPQACEPGLPAAAADRNSIDLAKRDWLLRCLLDLRSLSAPDCEIPRHAAISTHDFLHAHYAANRPALLTGMVAHWPAVGKWTPHYLQRTVGPAEIEYQGARAGDAAYERAKDSHRAKMPFDAFVDMIERQADGNNAYITAYNTDCNRAAFAPLARDLGPIDAMLEDNADGSEGMLWIGGAGTFTPLHHDLTNNLLVQVVGTKHVVLIPPEETPRLLNDKHVFSQFHDIENGDCDAHPQLGDMRIFRTELKAGEALFLPIGWWHQVVAEDFSVSITYTNFRWRNDFHRTYPAD